MGRRVTVTSPINGREIGRGTIVRITGAWWPASRHLDGAVGIVDRLERDRHGDDHIVSVLFPSHDGYTIRHGRGAEHCVIAALGMGLLEPIGEVKRMPKCDEKHRWVRPSNRKHRVRDAEIGRRIRSLQGALGGDRDDEIHARLVVLDRKLERLPVGPRRKHR